MFAHERRKLVKDHLKEHKQIEVSKLGELLKVSEVTIRRDLEFLENEGFLTRIYGGAFLNESLDLEKKVPAEDAESLELAELGKIATHFINDNSAIIIGPGKTNIHIAKQLKSKSNVKVITTDLNIVDELCNDQHSITPVIIGGDVDIFTKQVSGAITSMFLSNMHVDLSFVEVDGITLEKGYYVDSYEKASITQTIISISKITIAICNTDSFDNNSFFFLNDLDSFSRVIAMPSIPNSYKKYYYDKGIKLYTSFDIYQKPTL